MNIDETFYRTEWKKIDDHYSKEREDDDESLKEGVALKLKLYYESNNLTHAELAKRLGVTRLQVIRWLNRKSKPSPLAIKAMKELKII